MNVARKSTTKLPQNWQRVQKLQPKEDEADSGVASADSADSFQDALYNLKALSGGSDIAESDRSELKELQTTSTSEKKEDGNKNVAVLPPKSNGDEKDILDQIDDIMNEKETTSDQKIVGNGVLHSNTKDVMKSDQGSDEDDDVLIINEDEPVETKKECKEALLKKDATDSKSKSVPGTSTKNPLRIGEKVRSTVHSIMSKLVQSNPDVNSLLSKTKVEDSVDSSGSGAASPVSVRSDKGNLFDNFDISDRDSKSPRIAGTDTKPSQLTSTTDTDDGKLKEDTLLKNGVKKSSNGEGTNVAETKSEELSSNQQQLKSEDGGSTAAFETPESDLVKADGVQSVSGTDSQTETSSSKGAVVKTECGEIVSPMSPMKVTAVGLGDSAEKADIVALAGRNTSETNSKAEDTGSSLPQASSELKDQKSGLRESDAEGGESMDTTEPKLCDKQSEKLTEGKPKAIDKTDADRKRQHENGTPESDDSDGSQPPKRSRLDEVIGKLGERVMIPSDTPENDSFECDSTPGDTDSVEKHSEEISGSTSDEEEDKASSPDSKTKLKITKQDLEALVISTAKAAIERYQSSEILTLNRRVEELKESQEEWRQKAKDLERQVLDLTVLQQRLEKRKAHTAALKSITTRSIGVGVTEDKLKTNTPQKHPGNKTPPVGGGAPATPPATTIPTLTWTTSGQPLGRLVSTAPTSLISVPGGALTVTQSMPSRNTSVAHLLSQTARMPTAASCAAATRAVPAKPTNTAPRPPVSVTTLPVGQAPSVTPLSRGPNATTIPTTSLVLVNSTTPGVPMGNKVVSATHVGGASQASHPGATQVKYIDLTMEDDAGGAKQAGKQVLAQGQVRNMTPQQVVRQIPPLTALPQGVPGTVSSAILFSAPGVTAANLPRPGIVQVVTIANAGGLRPGALVTVVPGQPGAALRHPQTATTLTTNARESAPRLMTQQLSSGVTLVRPSPAILGNGSVRALVGGSPAGATSTAAAARMPLAVATLPSPAATSTSGAPHQEIATPAASAGPKKSLHPAPLPPGICPRGLAADVKPSPPRPGLKISRVKQGIVLSWNMTVPNDCVEIASYQLFAYQETSAAPQTTLWKKVGDVKALPLPMACTLTQFQDGNKYHFAVRAVDVHGRSGPFSDPSYIFLTKAS